MQALHEDGTLAGLPPSGRTRSAVRCVLLVLALVLGACTDASTATLDDPRAATTPQAPAPDIAPAPDGDPAPAPPSPAVCQDDLRSTLVAAVDGQLAAIAAQDWSGALAFATDGFRSEIDPERFRAIILDGFPVVAGNRARDIGRCRTLADDATLEVTVEDGDGTQQLLLYLFQRDEDGWGIGGATPADPATDQDDATSTV